MKPMRRFFLVSISYFVIIVLFSCRNNNVSDNPANGNSSPVPSDVVNIPASASSTSNGKLPKMVFADTNFDFGKITAGDKVTHIFVYKNEGEGDLVISNATASCGCTKPSYTHQVKHPGDTGTISVTFDSSNKSGKVVKAITISSNCQPPYKFLTINATIQPSNN
jgi:Protein of unknown function (DUF1573)